MAPQTKTDQDPTRNRPSSLRLWPGVALVAVQWLIRYPLTYAVPESGVMMFGVLGSLLCGIAVFVWWGFFSQAPMVERWGGIALMIGALVATSYLLDTSIATANMGLMFSMYAIPVMCLALVVSAALGRNLPVMPRRIIMTAAVLIAAGMWLFLRTDGMNGDARHSFAWRWATTSEDRLLAQPAPAPAAALGDSVAAPAATTAEWPGFRGRNRDGVVPGVRIKTDWSASPPRELWRRPVGPGCSSFSVNGDMLYTQEQRGEFEVVSCYRLKSGEAVWSHQDKARFYDSHAGAGPRSTPTLAGDRVYTLGGTGILNALNVADGSVIWSRDAAKDGEVKVLPWGFTSSPLVIADLVIVALSGKLAAFTLADGTPRWFGRDGGNSYSSPQLYTVGNVQQVLLVSKEGIIAVDPASGKKLWNYDWTITDRILQPAILENNDLLLTLETEAVRRISVTPSGNGYSVKELWTSTEMKLNFNDVVIHKGYAYGFDGSSIACMDLATGKRKWKGERYRGFPILLADQDLILVLTEKGELALVPAAPEKFTELAKVPAITGKTWNHPVLVGDVVVVRNAVEMAAFRLTAL